MKKQKSIECIKIIQRDNSIIKERIIIEKAEDRKRKDAKQKSLEILSKE